MFRFLSKMPFFSQMCTSKARLSGKTAIVTGCNTGIGKCTVADFYKRGARVIMACRDLKKAEESMDDILKNADVPKEEAGTLIIKKLDLSSMKSVRECAKDLLETEPQINILVNNAGIMMCPEDKTEDGFEVQFATNHLGHFLFTILLLPKIRKSTPARIVTVSSSGHKYGSIKLIEDHNFENTPYKPITAYGNSKLANVLFSSELARKLKKNGIEGVNTYSLHPGVITTELGRHLMKTLSRPTLFLLGFARWFFKTPEQGAQTTLYCSVDEKCANETGLYYEECAVKSVSIPLAKDAEAAEKLWDLSVNLTRTEHYDPFATEDKQIN